MENYISRLGCVLQKCPDAVASIEGGKNYPEIKGKVRFYQTVCGVVVAAEVGGLPISVSCNKRIFAFHIHSSGSCSGNANDEFADAGTHYNPEKCEHPYHAGDLPPIFSDNGCALQIFLTNRFSVDEIIGKTLIIHLGIDDFTSQPSGNSGEKIACGVIKRIYR